MPTEKLVQEILAKTPVTEIEVLRKGYEVQGFASRTFVKVLNPEKQIRQKVQWAVDLGMDKLSGLYTLDIGTGAGWFPYVLKCLGHNVEMSDVPDGTASVAYESNINLLGMKKDHSFYVRRNTPLPNSIFVHTYDLTTATGVAFHEDWDKSDWGFFVATCMNRLNKNGRLFLQINNTGKAEDGYEGFLDYLETTNRSHACLGYLMWLIYK